MAEGIKKLWGKARALVGAPARAWPISGRRNAELEALMEERWDIDAFEVDLSLPITHFASVPNARLTALPEPLALAFQQRPWDFLLGALKALSNSQLHYRAERALRALLEPTLSQLEAREHSEEEIEQLPWAEVLGALMPERRARARDEDPNSAFGPQQLRLIEWLFERERALMACYQAASKREGPASEPAKRSGLLGPLGKGVPLGLGLALRMSRQGMNPALLSGRALHLIFKSASAREAWPEGVAHWEKVRRPARSPSEDQNGAPGEPSD